VMLGAGRVSVSAPRVDDRRDKKKFTSSILPPYMRKSPKFQELIPCLYLKGVSTGSFQEAFRCILGDEAKGLSSNVVQRLTHKWQEEYRQWCRRDLSTHEYLYVWADGVNFSIRLEEENLSCLVVLGARADGTKEVLAISDGYRESKESWLDVLRDLRDRGLRAPLLAIGDGALGFWTALPEVFPTTKEQRCWVHLLGNVLDKLPKRLQPKAKRMLHDIMNAETKKDAKDAMKDFKNRFEATHPKSVNSLFRDEERLHSFFDFPAEHWVHLRTTNVIESVFATVKSRTKRTKGAGKRAAGLAMAFKLITSAEKRWRKLNKISRCFELANGVEFIDGIPVKQAESDAA